MVASEKVEKDIDLFNTCVFIIIIIIIIIFFFALFFFIGEYNIILEFCMVPRELSAIKSCQ